MTLCSHISSTIQKACGARTALYPVLNRNSPLPLATRLAIFKIYIKPILLYATPTERHLISLSNWSRLEAIQNVALRTITCTLILQATFKNLQDYLLSKMNHYSTKKLSPKNSTSLFPHLSKLVTLFNPLFL